MVLGIGIGGYKSEARVECFECEICEMDVVIASKISEALGWNEWQRHVVVGQD